MRTKKLIKAWSVVKTGQYRASSDLWTVSCIGQSRQEAIQRLRSQTGETWATHRAAGFEAVKIEIVLPLEKAR